MTFGDFSDLISFEDFTNISKWRHFATNKVSGYAFDILNECVAYERFKEELGRCKSGGGVALCKMCFYFV
jgi:hypothetical protein